MTRNLLAICWIKLLPALPITAWELLVGWPWPYRFTWAAHPIHWTFSLIQILIVSLRIPPLIGYTIMMREIQLNALDNKPIKITKKNTAKKH